MKRFISGFWCIVILLCAVLFIPTKAEATTSGATGSCTWSLNGTVLTISGSGNMGSYYFYPTLNYTNAPWGNEITHVIIENGVTNVGQYAFYGCKKLQSVTIPSSVKQIDTQAFRRTGLVSIVIPEGVKTIQDAAFEQCTALVSVTLPSSLTHIGNYAFQSCRMTSIVFSTKLKYIGTSAFNYGRITDVWYLGNKSDKGEITIESYNSCLNTATWHYDSCMIGAPHTYDNECDATCNECGIVRTVAEHVFDNVCDSVCNVCGDSRSVEHQYDDACDTKCNICYGERAVLHFYDEGLVTQEATCEIQGITMFTCMACGAKKYEPIAKLTEHTYDDDCDTVCNICQAVRTVEHFYENSWSKDEAGHWVECTECGQKKNDGKHVPGAPATETTPQTCTVCGYIINPVKDHVHQFGSEWKSDKNGHWYVCSGCEQKNSYEDHEFENACDTDCAACGYVREISHSFTEEYNCDQTSHWIECSVCGEKKDVNPHEPGAEATETTGQNCTVCGCEIAPALGAPNVTEPNTNGTNATVPTEDSDDGNQNKNEFPWWVLVLVGCVAVGVVVLMAVKKKKDQ